MIDTIKARFYGRLRDDILSRSSDDWEITFRGKKEVCQDSEFQPNQENAVTIKHRPTGYRFNMSEQGGEGSFEGSLPKIIHGENDKLLTSQQEVDKAWREVSNEMIPRFFTDLTPFYMWSPFTFTRVDAVWHVKERPSVVVNLHANARHPRVRKPTVQYGNHAVCFPGKERYLRIYDKGKESGTEEDQTCRVELQMRGSALEKEFSDKTTDQLGANGIIELDGEKAYQVLRKFCLKFQSQFQSEQTEINFRKGIKYMNTSTLVGILARAQREGTTWENGETIKDSWSRDKHPRTVKRMDRKIRDYEFRWNIFSWEDQLPQDFRQNTMQFTT